MPIRDKLVAAALVLIWGLNFVVIKFGLQGVPPLALGALRFVFVAFPAIFFIRRPSVPLHLLVAYGLTISFGQFAFLFSALYAGMPTGLASLVLQVQAFVSLALAAVVFGERFRIWNFVGLALAFVGLGLLVLDSSRGNGAPLIGFVLTLCAATSWAVGNILSKSLGKVDVLALVVWSALVPIAPFLLASALFEDLSGFVGGLSRLPLVSVGAIAYLSIGASLVGYSIWGHLLASHPVWKIAPLTLLVPLVGLISGWLVFGEKLTIVQIVASAIVLAGLVVNVFGGRVIATLFGRGSGR